MASSIRRVILFIILFMVLNSSIVIAQSNIKRSIYSTGSIVSISNNAGQLRAEGTKIVDENGNSFRILSMTFDGNERLKKDGSSTSISNTPRTDPYEAWFTPDDVDFFKAFGYNTIEIHMMLLRDVSKADGSINQRYFVDYVDEWVKWVTEKDLYVILNFQRFNPKPGAFENYGWYYVPNWFYADYGYPSSFDELAKICLDFYDTNVAHMDDERENYYKVLEYIADRYKDNPRVMISPRNEPQHFVHKYAGEQGYPSKLRIAEGYNEIAIESIDRMRATGYSGLIFIELPYAYTEIGERYDNLIPIKRANIVWEYHVYVSNNHDIQTWERKVSESKAVINSLNKPYYLGEWGLEPMGIKDNYGLEYVMSQMMGFLDSNDINFAFHSYGRIWGFENWVADTYNQLSTSEIKIMENVMKK